jgi:hypothetical protein
MLRLQPLVHDAPASCPVEERPFMAAQSFQPPVILSAARRSCATEGKSKDPEDISGSYAASGSSLDKAKPATRDVTVAIQPLENFPIIFVLTMVPHSSPRNSLLVRNKCQATTLASCPTRAPAGKGSAVVPRRPLGKTSSLRRTPARSAAERASLLTIDCQRPPLLDLSKPFGDGKAGLRLCSVCS